MTSPKKEEEVLITDQSPKLKNRGEKDIDPTTAEQTAQRQNEKALKNSESEVMRSTFEKLPIEQPVNEATSANNDAGRPERSISFKMAK